MAIHKIRSEHAEAVVRGDYKLDAQPGDFVKVRNRVYYLYDRELVQLAGDHNGWELPVIKATGLMTVRDGVLGGWLSSNMYPNYILNNVQLDREADFIRGLLHCVDNCEIIPGTRCKPSPDQSEALRRYMSSTVKLVYPGRQVQYLGNHADGVHLTFEPQRWQTVFTPEPCRGLADLGEKLLTADVEGFDLLRNAMHDVALRLTDLTPAQKIYIRSWAMRLLDATSV